ncbi:MAG: hypothetical protein U0074_01010 [Kouleothrix sp.]
MGIVLDDPALAMAYAAYVELLAADPPAEQLRPVVRALVEAQPIGPRQFFAPATTTRCSMRWWRTGPSALAQALRRHAVWLDMRLWQPIVPDRASASAGAGCSARFWRQIHSDSRCTACSSCQPGSSSLTVRATTPVPGAATRSMSNRWWSIHGAATRRC